MSTSIYWEPVKREKQRVPGGSTVHGIIEKQFGPLPVEIGEGHLRILQGMAAVDPKGPWLEFACAIQRHGIIEITVSY